LFSNTQLSTVKLPPQLIILPVLAFPLIKEIFIKVKAVSPLTDLRNGLTLPPSMNVLSFPWPTIVKEPPYFSWAKLIFKSVLLPPVNVPLLK